MASWDDTSVRARAGLFLDILRLTPSLADLGEGNSLDKLRRDIAKKIARLETKHAGDQTLLESLVPMRAWLLGRFSDYLEWVLPCLDYLFVSLAASHGALVPEPVVSSGFFDFSTFDKEHFAEAEALASDRESPDKLDFIKEHIFAGSEIERELAVVAYLLNRREKLGDIACLLNVGAPDEDYSYVDGHGFCETGRRRQAKEIALRLLDRCPDVEEYHGELGYLLLQLGAFENAIVCFQRQQRHAPEDGLIHNNIAWCQMKCGRTDEALASAEKAIAQSGENPEVHHDYAAILSSRIRGELDQAIERTAQALATFPESGIQLYYLKAFLLDRAGRPDAAVAAWLDYLRRAHGQPGHRKAVARAVAALGALGHAYSITRYPIRVIAEQAIQEISKRVIDASNHIKNSALPIDCLERLERDLSTYRWTDMNGLENHCRELFDRSEKILTRTFPRDTGGPRVMGFGGFGLSQGFFNPIGPLSGIDWEKVREGFRQMRDEQERRQLPYYVLLRDGVRPMLQEIIRHAKVNIAGHLAKVDKVVNVVPWVLCRDALKHQDGRVPPVDALQRLLTSWQDRPRRKTPTVNICIADLCHRLPTEVAERIGTGEGAFGLQRVNSALQSYEEQASEAEEAIAQAEERLGRTERVVQRVVRREAQLRRKQQMTEKQLSDWSGTKREADAALRDVQSIEPELAYCRSLRKATGFWAALTGRTERIRQISVKVSQLGEQVCCVFPDLRPLPIFSKDPEADLACLKNEIPGWLKVAQTRLAAKIEEANRQAEQLRGVKAAREQKFQKRRLASEWEWHQASDQQREQTERHDQARQYADALKRLKDEIPGCGLLEGKDIVALCVLHNGNGDEPLFCCGGLTDDPIVLCSLDLARRDELPGHAGGVTSLAAARSKPWIVSGGMDGQIRLWSTQPPTMLRSLSVDSPIYSLALSGDWLFAGAENNVVVCTLPDLSPVTTLPGLEGEVLGLACDQKRQRLYAVTANFAEPPYSAIYVWDLLATGPSFRLLQRLRGFGGAGLCLALDPAGKWLAAGEGLGSIESPEPSQILLWDAETLRLKKVVAAHDGWVESLAFSPDGRWLVSGDAVGPIQQPAPSRLLLHDLASGETRLALQPHGGWVRSLAFDPTGSLLFSGGSDGMYVWDFGRLLKKEFQTTVTFKVKATKQVGQSVYLVGDSPLLGNWVPEAGIKLSPTDYPTWSVTISLPPSARLEYKYLKRDEAGNTTWEEGGNRNLFTPSKGESVQQDSFGARIPQQSSGPATLVHGDQAPRKRLSASACAPGLLEADVNLHSLRRYVASRFPDAPSVSDQYLARFLVPALDPLRYRKIRDVDAAFSRGFPGVQRDLDSDTSEGRYRHAGEYVCVAIAFADKEYRNYKHHGWSDKAQEAFRRFATEEL